MRDVRCPVNPSRLFFKIGGDAVVGADNVIEVACKDCRDRDRKAGHRTALVVHRFTVAGDLVATHRL